jgi:signal transduction histidine kinase
VAQASLVALSILLSGLAVFVWRARPQHGANRWFACATLLLACWVFAIAGLQSGENLDVWGRFAFASAAPIPATFLALTRAYAVPSKWPSRLMLRLTLSIGGLFGILALATPLIVVENLVTPDGLVRKAGPLHPLFTIYFLIVWCAALALFIRKWQTARGLERAQLQYLGAGILISGSGAISVNLVVPLVTGRSTHSWIGPYFSLALVILVGHAIIRHRLMDLRVVVKGSLAYGFAMLLVSLLVVTVGRLTLTWWNDLPVVSLPDILTLVIVSLAMLSAPAQWVFNSAIDRYLFRGRIDHAQALKQAMRRLSRLMQPNELVEELRDILQSAFVAESFGMHVNDPGDVPNDPVSQSIDSHAGLLSSADFRRFLQDQPNPSVLLVDPFRCSETDKRRHEILKKSGIDVVVVLGRRGLNLGSVALGPRRSGDAYFDQDLSFIESIAELASVSLENAILYRHRIQISEYSNRLLESLNSAVVAIDVAGSLTSFNRAAVQLFGLNEGYIHNELTVLPSEVAWALALTARSSWQATDVEASIDQPGGTRLPIMLSTAILRDDKANVTGALAVATDLSTIKALERNHRRVEHLATMARFYAGIAHEIRSPLTSISNFVSMLPDRFNDPEYRDTAIRLLPAEVQRIVRLAERLRSMAPGEDGSLAVVSLAPLLTDIVAINNPSARDKNITLKLEYSNNLPPILGDRAQLVQLFVNLLNNATEAMPYGGVVVIRASVVGEDGSNRVTRVQLLDEGTGIAAAARARVFQPFFTTKPSGTGLGLSICREIADFHRASLLLLPRLDGIGTEARIDFPCLPSDAEQLKKSKTVLSDVESIRT